MNNLVCAEFSRLFKSFIFRLGALFSFGFAVFAIFMRYMDVVNYPSEYTQLPVSYSNADGLIFAGGFYLVFALAVFVILFVGTEYSDGTMRNKLIAGHLRFRIYLSKLIVCAAANVLFHLLYIITALLLGFLLIHGVTYSSGILLKYILLGVCVTLAFSAVLVCLSMCIPNKAVSAVTGLLLTIILLGSALTISMRLSAPEYTEAFAYTDEASGKLIKVDRERNDQYLTGTKRKIYTFLYDFLPTCQFYQIVQVSDTPIENYGILIAYDGLLLFLSTGPGILIFGKKDLK